MHCTAPDRRFLKRQPTICWQQNAALVSLHDHGGRFARSLRADTPDLPYLLAFRRQHWESLSKGQTWLEVEESGLIHVKRTGKETIEGWFNTTGQAVSLSAEVTLSRGYEAGQLASKGYVLGVK